MFHTNTVICPKCNHYFDHNLINGLELIDATNRIDARKRMYCRLVLDTMERLDKEQGLTFPAVKKVILDSFNDLTRDVATILGLGADVE